MSTVFQESNFYNSMAVMYFDLVVFGTAAVLIYEDFDDVIRCFNPCLGEFFIDVDNKFRVTIFYRRFVMTTAQIVDEFGEENCSQSVRRLYAEGGVSLTLEHVVAHAIEPNNDNLYGVPKRFRYPGVLLGVGFKSKISCCGRRAMKSFRGWSRGGTLLVMIPMGDRRVWMPMEITDNYNRRLSGRVRRLIRWLTRRSKRMFN